MPSKNKKAKNKEAKDNLKNPSSTDADAQKNAGNAAFENKEFDKAIEHYTNAIKLDNTNPVFFSNRAQVYIC